MATNYTANYGLCQWEPEDNFLREEFNQDNAKIDAAIKTAEEGTQALAEEAQGWVQAAESAAEARAKQVEDNARSWANAAQSAAQAAQSTANRALKDLEPVGYNVYNLLLQNYYEGKATGYKKALLFDGFRDESGISGMTGVVWDASNPSLLLDALGQQTIPEGRRDKAYQVPRLTSASSSWTATGNGTLTMCTLPVMGTGTAAIYHGKELLASQTFLGGDGGTANISIPFSVAVTAGQTYTLTITNTGTSTMVLIAVMGEDDFCYALTFTPKTATSGSMTGASQAVSGTFQSAKAWVRHSNGTPALSLMGNGGSWKALTKGSTRTTVNADGVSCTETEFSLSSALTGPIQAKLELSVSSGSQMRVYDYGVLFY